MHPIRNLSILALFLLASASAFAATDTLVINITVTITAQCDIEWVTGEKQNARTWTINPAVVNFAYSSLAAALNDIKDSVGTGVGASTTSFNIYNNSTNAIPINGLTVKISAEGGWQSVTGIAAHGPSDKYLMRFNTSTAATSDVVNGAGTNYSTVGAPAWTDIPATAATANVNAAAIAPAATQTFALEFITPFAVTANVGTCTITLTATN
jgi:hypothetical protein